MHFGQRFGKDVAGPVPTHGFQENSSESAKLGMGQPFRSLGWHEQQKTRHRSRIWYYSPESNLGGVVRLFNGCFWLSHPHFPSSLYPHLS